MKKPYESLPDFLRPLFWDQDFDTLGWDRDRDFVIRRILQNGSWHAISWLRTTLSDPVLRDWLVTHAGSRLSPRQLRFWELALDLPPAEVDQWIAREKDQPWERRLKP